MQWKTTAALVAVQRVSELLYLAGALASPLVLVMRGRKKLFDLPG